MEAWTQFFIRAGIPKDIAQKYAKSFNNNRITKEMLPELDKSTLSELGVTAIGDQLCILRRIKAAKSAIERGNDDDMDEIETMQKPVVQKAKITGPTVNFTGISGNSEHRRGKPPPDRHEIYHVKMPVGNTLRTRQIMQKAEQMREQGLAVRGTTGVRQGGRSVSPIDKNSLAARMQRKQISEVSSSTDRRQGHIKIPRIAPSGIKKTISNRPSLSSRLTTSSGNRPSGSSLRIQVGQGGRKMSRIEGRLQKVPASRVYLEDEEEMYEMEDVEYPDDEMAYEEEVEEYEEVVTVPVHQRITYGQSSSSGRLQSTVQRAPPRVQAPSSSSYRNREMSPPSSDSSVFSRISYHNRR